MKSPSNSIAMANSKPKQCLSIFILFFLTTLMALAVLRFSLNSSSALLATGSFLHSSSTTHPQLKFNCSSIPNSRGKSTSLCLLQPNAMSLRFSARASKFFRGKRCEVRFFMTWICRLDSFGQRELLSIESLFKSHPKACLLIASDAMDSSKGAMFVKPFLDKGFRVAALSPDYHFLLENTPAVSWFESLRRGDVDPGKVSLGQNLSNLLRLALVYKFGGIYVDMDVIILKSLLHLKNVIGAQAVDAGTGNWSRLNNAVFVFDKGHPLLYKFIEEFALTFNGNKWGFNGPYLVSRVAKRVAGRPGFEFRVLPPAAFYPVDWNNIQELLQGPRGRRRSKWVSMKYSTILHESFTLHLWNSRSKEVKVEEDSVVGRLLLDCCVLCNSSTSTKKNVRIGTSLARQKMETIT